MFRDSTGELLGEHRNGVGIGYNPSNHRLSYSLVIPGFDQRGSIHYGKGRESGVQYGEWIDVVVLNRATGYLSMRVIQAKPGADGIDIDVDAVAGEPSQMRPPNLKMYVSREFDGLIRGDTLQDIYSSTIAFEGSGLTSDKQVYVYSDWRDQSGRLLPAELPGYTGRITRVIESKGASELANSGTGVAHFSILPNTHLQVLRLSDAERTTAREHFYVHVNGKSDGADFSPDKDAQGLLQYRPKHPVPTLIQVADIGASNTLKEELIPMAFYFTLPGSHKYTSPRSLNEGVQHE